MTSRPVFYSFRRCPYAMRARLAIASAGIEVRLREVVLRDKPAHMLDISPKGTVPVLQLADGDVIDESLDVMLWALGQSDPEGWLVPLEADRETVMALIAANDGDFKHHLDRYKYANRYEGTDPHEHRKGASSFLATLEVRLSASDYLFGQAPTFADFAILPFVRQFAHVDPVWFARAPYPRLRDWLEAFKASERFKAMMKKYPQWKAGEPEAEFPS